MDRQELSEFVKEQLELNALEYKFLSRLTDEDLTFYVDILKRFPEVEHSFSTLAFFGSKQFDRSDVERIYREKFEWKNNRIIGSFSKEVKPTEKSINPSPQPDNQGSTDETIQELTLEDLILMNNITIISEIAKLQNKKPPENKEDLEKILALSNESNAPNEITLKTFIEYLNSEERYDLQYGIEYGMVYYIEKSGILPEHRELAKMECILSDKNDLVATFDAYYPSRNSSTTSLLGRPITDYANNPDDPFNKYIISLIKNPSIINSVNEFDLGSVLPNVTKK